MSEMEVFNWQEDKKKLEKLKPCQNTLRSVQTEYQMVRKSL